MEKGVLPRDWVTANVVPIHKKCDKRLASNYHPISLTSVFVKTMERIIRSQLVNVLEEDGCISEEQFGFRKNRSTTSLLLSAVHDWSYCLEKCSTMHCVFLDLAKAFDSVPHEHLLLKLRYLGISGDLLNWIRFFLTERFQRVVVKGFYSSWTKVKSGVPQGSVLGPILFLLYIDDLRHEVEYSTLKVYADDIAIYREVKSERDCVLIQQDLDRVFNWSMKWQLRLNSIKCNALEITNKRSRLSSYVDYRINGVPIQWSAVVKYLGILLNYKLNWSDHCNYVASKAAKVLNYLRHTLQNATVNAKSIAYKFLVRPI